MCKYCPELHGIMKRTKIDGDEWAHVACVNWISTIYWDSDRKENVADVPKEVVDIPEDTSKEKKEIEA